MVTAQARRAPVLLLFLAQTCGFTAAIAAEPETRPAHPASTLQLPDVHSSSVRANTNLVIDSYPRRTPLSKTWAAARSGKTDQLQAEDRDTELIGTIEIKPWLLTKPTEQDVDFSKPVTGTGLPRQFAHLALSIGDREISLWVVGVTQDGPLRHISAAVTNVPDASALFTVTADERVYGTINLPDASYRILPVSPNAQAVYKLASRINGQPGRDAAVVTRMATQDQALQRRHLQAAKIGELQFDLAHFRPDGNTFASRGGRLGRFSPQSATGEQIAALLAQTGALANVDRLSQFQIVERRAHLVRFEQLINGIPVAARNEITTTPEGNVDEIRLLLTDPARAPTGNAISKAEAISRATKAYAAGATADVEITSEPRLLYRRTAEGEPLELVYQLSMRRPNAPHSIVRVNALTGEVAINDATLRVDEFGQDVYVADSGAPSNGSEPGARLQYSDPNGMACPPENAGPCITTEMLWLGMIFRDVRRAWQSATDSTDPNLCCDRLGTKNSDNIQFIYNTAASPHIAMYDGADETILFKAPPGTDPSAALNTDTVAHEMTHHFLAKIGGLGTDDDFSRMLHEGLADAMVGAIAEMRTPYAEWTGNPNAIDLNWQGENWVVGDGTSPIGSTRDMRADKQLSWIASVLPHVANPDRFHLASLAISNFFYRLYGKGVMTDTRLVELILKTATWLNDWNQSGALDLNDFYFAVTSSTRSSEATLRTAINQVWGEMGGTTPPPSSGPNPPGPTTPPAAPGAVDGFAVTCDSGIAIHRAFWSATANTSSYRTYVGPFEDIFDASVTAVYAWSNFSTDFRVRSCNVAGCSAQSVDSYYMNYNAVCGF